MRYSVQPELLATIQGGQRAQVVADDENLTAVIHSHDFNCSMFQFAIGEAVDWTAWTANEYPDQKIIGTGSDSLYLIRSVEPAESLAQKGTIPTLKAGFKQVKP